MKIFNRFSAQKSAFGAAALALALFAFASCENMTTLPPATMQATASKTLYAPTFPEKAANAGETLSYGERYYTITQGSKRKISLSWTPVEIAKYYEVFSAENVNDTFIKVGETTKTEFDDSVSSGKTYYYKVRAVNAKGECSEFSSTVRGTSLATPAITDISITDTSATVFWYMGNVNLDSYAKNLVYEVHAFKGNDEKVFTIEAWDSVNNRAIEEYEFTNLNGNAEYLFRVDAYTKADTSQVESSPKVSQKTLSLYKPIAPEFTASQGESVKNVKLIITLPPKVQVQEDKDTDYDSPICFKIQRKKNNAQEWSTIVPCLYFNGSQTAISKADKDQYDKYKEGDMIEWEDSYTSSANSVKPGIKYDYRIISCVDVNFAKVNDYKFNATVESKEADANIATGWVACEPEFKVKNIERTINPSNSDKISNVAVTFEASWDGLGKESLYKFAVKQDFKRALDDAEGVNWLSDDSGNKMFDSIDAVNSLTASYDLTSGAEFLCGTYKFTLYIISTEYSTPDAAVDSNNYLAFKEDRNKVSVSDNATLPNADLQAEGGWIGKTKLSWFAESGVTYKLLKTDITARTAETTISNDDILDGIGAAAYTPGSQINFYDTNVEGGHEYSYSLVATKGVSNATSLAQTAKTLGTAAPSVLDNKYYYNKVVVTWSEVMAAQHYDITLGKRNEFGNGASVTLDQEGNVVSSNFTDGATATATKESSTITLTIQNPYGYSDALLSGAACDVEVQSSSEVGKDVTTAKESVWTVGPAKTAAAGTDTTLLAGDKITVTWKGLEGAAGYAVYRTRQAISGSTDKDGNVGSFASEKTDVYYVTAESTPAVTVNGSGSGGTAAVASRANDSSGQTYTLTDNYAQAAAGETDQWKISQSCIGMGIKYTYTVLPVLKADDAATISESLEEEVKLTGEKYANLDKVQTIGYTAGYGLNLEASKAEYTDRVVLTWDVPTNNDQKERYPTIYYKTKTGAWTKIAKLEDAQRNYYVFDSIPKTDNTSEPLASSADRLKPLEFAVTYNGSFEAVSTTAPTDAAYKNYLSKIENAQIVAGEAKSIGYMFTLPAITGTKTEEVDYSEKVLWDTYNTDSEGRSVGPESYTLSLKNLNNSADYKALVTYDSNGENGTVQSIGWADAAITQNNATGTTTRTVTVKPNFLNVDAGAGVHNGLLKVQRDYKHWYQITASRTSKADYYKFSSFDDEKIAKPASTIVAHSEDYACRKITDQEFAKCIGLIICDAINQAGIYEGNGATVGGKTGEFHIKHHNASKTLEWGTNNTNYTHIFRSGNVGDTTKELTSGWAIKLYNSSKNKNSEHKNSVNDHKVYYLCTNHDDTGGMTVTHETGFASYQGNVDIQVGAQNYKKNTWSYKFEKDSTPIQNFQDDDQAKFQLWFPFDIGDSIGKVYDYTDLLGWVDYYKQCHEKQYKTYAEGHDIKLNRDGTSTATLPEYEKTWWQEHNK